MVTVELTKEEQKRLDNKKKQLETFRKEVVRKLLSEYYDVKVKE